jgi:hypothetical protein
MRSLPALLLLCLLPALLLPAGLLLRVCACAEARVATETASCCAAEAPEPVASCCRDASERPADGAPTASALDCRCRLVPVGDDAPTTMPGAPFVLALPPVHGSAVPPVPAPTTHAQPRLTFSCRAPPPYGKRNLPLRL